ncbi:MAG: hypothetical protein ACUZ8H_09830, partial [Candidatus Anammoxibacter sp.]
MDLKNYIYIATIIALATLSRISYSFAESPPHKHEQPPAPVVVTKVIEKQFKEPVTLIGTVKPD